MTALRKLLIVTFVIVASASAVIGQTQCSRYTNAESGFSVCLPADWTRSDGADDPFPNFSATGVNGGGANLNFQLAKTSEPLADYVTAANKYSLEHTKELGFDSLTLVSRTEFVTSSKVHGVRLIYSETYKGIKLKASQFYFDLGPSQKILLTFTYKEALKALNDEFFDNVAASLQLEK